MKTIDDLVKVLTPYSSDFSKVSKDDESSVSMIDSPNLIYNFDKFKNENFKDLKSCDGIWIDSNNDDIYLIEFKNGTLEKPKKDHECNVIKDQYHNEYICQTLREYYDKDAQKKKQEVQLKISDSLIMLMETRDCSLFELKKDVSYILVYNGTKNPSSKDKIIMHQQTKAKVYTKRFALHKKYEKYFKDFQTLTAEEFKEYFESSIGILL